jgi:hypothetical protein
MAGLFHGEDHPDLPPAKEMHSDRDIAGENFTGRFARTNSSSPTTYRAGPRSLGAAGRPLHTVLLSEIVGQNIGATPANFSRVLRPHSLTPVSVTTCLSDEQVEQSISVSLAVCVNCAVIEDLVKLSTQLVHRGQHIFIPLHPADVVGPRSSLHGEVRFLTLEVGEDPVGRARFPFRDALENTALMDWPAAR